MVLDSFDQPSPNLVRMCMRKISWSYSINCYAIFDTQEL